MTDNPTPPARTAAEAGAATAAAAASVQVARVTTASPQVVYAIAADPRRLPEWAHGLAESSPRVRPDGVVEVDSPYGVVTVAFVPRNDLGVLDHLVTLPDGTQVLNPLRVVAHPRGAEIVFTVRRTPGTTAQEHEADAAAVQRDLDTLAALAEGRPAEPDDRPEPRQ